jgi:hypothetical protein
VAHLVQYRVQRRIKPRVQAVALKACLDSPQYGPGMTSWGAVSTRSSP